MCSWKALSICLIKNTSSTSRRYVATRKRAPMGLFYGGHNHPVVELIARTGQFIGAPAATHPCSCRLGVCSVRPPPKDKDGSDAILPTYTLPTRCFTRRSRMMYRLDFHVCKCNSA